MDKINSLILEVKRIIAQLRFVRLKMISYDEIRKYASLIAERFHGASIVLFGSQARGDARPDSDVDLLVVMPFEGKGMRQAVAIRQELRAPFALDLVVRRPDEIATRTERRDFFLQDVMNTGLVLYDRGNI